MTEAPTAVSGLQAKIDLLQPGNLVYFHPTNNADHAFLGPYRGIKQLTKVRPEEPEGDHLRISPKHITFMSIREKETTVWIPKYIESRGVLIAVSDFLKGAFELYVGLGNIKKGMEEHNNPNFGLVEVITKLWE